MNEIKELTIDYLDEAINLFISVFSKEPWNDEYESREQVVNYFSQFRNSNYFKGFVLIADGKVIGVSLGLLSPSLQGLDYFIHEFCIDTSFQRQKLGSLFLTLIEKQVVKENINQIILTTAKDYPAEYFYKGNGFIEQESSLLLTKKLNKKEV